MAAAAVGVLTVVCLVKADVFLFLAGLLPVAPATLFVAWTLPVIAVMPFTRGGRRGWRVVGRLRPVLVPLLAGMAIGLVSGALRSESTFHDWRTLGFPAFTLYVFISGVSIACVLRRQWWKGTVGVAFVVIVGTIWLDVARPYTFTLPDLVGPAGLPQNPNSGALVVLLLLAVIVGWSKHASARIGAVVVGTLTVVATASRSGMLTAVSILAFCLWRMGRRQAGLVVGCVTIAGIVVLFTGWAGEAVLETAQRIGLPTQKLVDFIDPHGSTLTLSDSSSVERLDALQRSFALIVEAPFVGHGTGYSYEMPVGPHNMYVARLVDNGAIGLVAYVWLLVAVGALNWRGANWSGVAVSGVVMLFGLFSHNLFEDRTVMLLLSITSMQAAIDAEETGGGWTRGERPGAMREE